MVGWFIVVVVVLFYVGFVGLLCFRWLVVWLLHSGWLWVGVCCAWYDVACMGFAGCCIGVLWWMLAIVLVVYC